MTLDYGGLSLREYVSDRLQMFWARKLFGCQTDGIVDCEKLNTIIYIKMSEF